MTTYPMTNPATTSKPAPYATILIDEGQTSSAFDEDCFAPPPPRSPQTVRHSSHPTRYDNDCHHPDDFPDDSGYNTDVGALFALPEDAFTAPLPGAFHLAHAPGMVVGPAVLDQSAWARWQAFRSPTELEPGIDHRLAELRLVRPLSPVPAACQTEPGTLTAWIHITNACNLECPYCYVRKSNERMSRETGLHAIEAVFRTARRHGFRRVKLKYAGGEATLHFKLVRELHQRAVELARPTAAHLWPIEVSEVLLSNGVRLRPEDAEWLAEHEVRVTISVDGVGQLHNELRPVKGRSDGNTFNAVEHTVDKVLRAHGILPHITMTVTGLNARGAADVARWAMIERGLTTSFSFYRPNLLSLSRADLAYEEQSLIDGMLAAYAAIESNLPLWPFLDGLLDRVKADAHLHTCGVGQNYLVITHTGALAQCQMHLSQPIQLHLNGDLLAATATGPLRNLPVNQKEGCRECSYRHLCAGGCPLETYRVTGRWDVQSPNCRVYKALLPAAWRLEGLRLLKRNGYLS